MTDNTDRSVSTEALTRKPDVSRLVKRNRPAVAPAAPVTFQAEPAGVATTPIAAPVLGDSEPTAQPAAAAPREPGEQPPAKPKAVKSTDATGAKKTMTVYVGSEVRRRSRAAFQATSYEEQDASWSEFVEKAMLAEAERREKKHNGGKPFAGGTQRLAGGRPLKDD